MKRSTTVLVACAKLAQVVYYTGCCSQLFVLVPSPFVSLSEKILNNMTCIKHVFLKQKKLDAYVVQCQRYSQGTFGGPCALADLHVVTSGFK